MRIRFIEPRSPGHHVYDRALLPRLGLPLMATMLRELGQGVGEVDAAPLIGSAGNDLDARGDRAR